VKVNPNAMGTRQAVIGGVLVLLVLAGCYFLVLGLRHNGWGLVVGGLLIETGSEGFRWFTGEGTHFGKCMRTVAGWLVGFRERRAEVKYRQRQASATEVLRSAYLEERVNELVNLRIERRLTELERANEFRTRQEWTELRDVWRVLILDPNTPEEVRASCREWLAKYPETLDFLARRLMNLGLLREKELLLDDDWEERERHKWRIQ
jgi:hypothetical protein